MNKIIYLVLSFFIINFNVLGDNKVIESQCNFSGTNINISLKIDLNINKIDLSGLKKCEITYLDKSRVIGKCSPPSYSELDFIPEYINESGVGRWSMKVADESIIDAQGNIIYFEYLCKKNLLKN